MKQLIFIISIILAGLCLLAQSPQAFQYQAVVRDACSNPVFSQHVSMQKSIQHVSLYKTS